MCGFVGFLSCGQGSNAAPALLQRMADALTHRGPDSYGYWSDATHDIGLAHRRLAIMDLSPAGAQPMTSRSGRYVIAFNGEIYNHAALRAELGGVWRGQSDTETLLAGFDAWGIQVTVAKCIGMFAFAVWDTHTLHLSLGRDRLGEKPLYYGWQGQGYGAVFLFGSELKALKKHPAFAADIDRDALCLYMRHSYIPAPYSIYQGIAKLEPGCLLTVSAVQPTPLVERYWSPVQVALAGVTAPFAGTHTQAVDALEDLLKSAVQQQMVADVRLGAFLSGGIDSSTVVALMQAQSDLPVKTFTVGFVEESYNEAVHAKAVAQHLGTDHTELYVSPQQALDVIPKLPHVYCEPFADSSQIPTFLVSQLARHQVAVSLSGDAGDELFGGYNRYVLADRLWRSLSAVPVAGRRWAAQGIRAVSPRIWNAMAKPLQAVLPPSLRQVNWGDKLHKAADVLPASSLGQLYLGLVSQWAEPTSVVIGGTEPPTRLTGLAPDLQDFDDIQRMMVLDTLTYLPDDILTKVDRASMGASLEARVPFLDHRVVEFAWKLPQNLKLRNGVGKWVLREVLYRYVPKDLIERPKMGFGVPIGDWLCGPLRDWAEDLLAEDRLQREGFFHPAPIRQKWAEHRSGVRNWQHYLWPVLMFEAWLQDQDSINVQVQ